MTEAILELKNIRKSFDQEEILKGIDLIVEEGEFITFLGPSGCGKTTTLRIIAGLEEPDSGEVILCGENVTNFPPEKRNVNTVFQAYALFPHMTVAENVGYGLKLKKMPKEEIKKKVTEMLDLVQLTGFETRSPEELSGGQQQRVAIGRGLINQPKILLLDEPLGALDLQLRRQMQLELKRLQKKMGITFIYITHDQEEAINMSDRIVVMKDGQFQQIGTPDQVFNTPKTAFVATFVGNANVVSAKIQTPGDEAIATVGNQEIKICGTKLPKGTQVSIACRTENVLVDQKEGINVKVREKSFVGGLLRIEFATEDGILVVASRHGIDFNLQIGQETKIGWLPENVVIVES